MATNVEADKVVADLGSRRLASPNDKSKFWWRQRVCREVVDCLQCCGSVVSSSNRAQAQNKREARVAKYSSRYYRSVLVQEKVGLLLPLIGPRPRPAFKEKNIY